MAKKMNFKKIFNFKDKKAVKFGIIFAIASLISWFIGTNFISNVLGVINYIPLLIYNSLITKIIVLNGILLKLVIAKLAFLEGMLIYHFIGKRLRFKI